MPRSTVNVQHLLCPDEAPLYLPWKSMKDPARNLVRERRVSESQLKKLQDIAGACHKWADWHRKCGTHSLMLAASTLSIDRLAAFLDDLSDAICGFDYRYKAPKKTIPIKIGRDIDPRAHLFAVLDAVEVIRTVIAGQEILEPVEVPDDPEREVPEFARVWCGGTVYESGYVARALGQNYASLATDIRSLPRESHLTTKLRDATSQVCRDLHETIREAEAKSPASTAADRNEANLALRELSSIASDRESRWFDLLPAIDKLCASIDAWRAKRWTGGSTHETKQWKGKQLSRGVAFLRQYGLLMRATAQRHRMLVRLDALVGLVREIGNCVTKLIGPPEAPYSAGVAKLFRVDLVEPEWRERWMALPEALQKNAQKAIGTVLKKGQRTPWMIGAFMDAFLRAEMIGGENLADKKRRIVDEVLVPMQSVGLAAQGPWDDLFAVPIDRPVAGFVKFGAHASGGTMLAPAGTDNGYRGKKWVVNPFGAHLRVG